MEYSGVDGAATSAAKIAANKNRFIGCSPCCSGASVAANSVLTCSPHLSEASRVSYTFVAGEGDEASYPHQIRGQLWGLSWGFSLGLAWAFCCFFGWRAGSQSFL